MRGSRELGDVLELGHGRHEGRGTTTWGNEEDLVGHYKAGQAAPWISCIG